MLDEKPDWTWGCAARQRVEDCRRRKRASRRRGRTVGSRRWWCDAYTDGRAIRWAWRRCSEIPWFSGPRKSTWIHLGTDSPAQPDWHRRLSSNAPRKPSPLRLDPFSSLRIWFSAASFSITFPSFSIFGFGFSLIYTISFLNLLGIINTSTIRIYKTFILLRSTFEQPIPIIFICSVFWCALVASFECWRCWDWSF